MYIKLIIFVVLWSYDNFFVKIFKQVFGREYDLDLFNIVAVPDFNMLVLCFLHFVIFYSLTFFFSSLCLSTLLIFSMDNNWFFSFHFQGSDGKQELECMRFEMLLHCIVLFMTFP